MDPRHTNQSERASPFLGRDIFTQLNGCSGKRKLNDDLQNYHYAIGIRRRLRDPRFLLRTDFDSTQALGGDPRLSAALAIQSGAGPVPLWHCFCCWVELCQTLALWSFRIPPCPHRRSRASTSCCSSLPSEPRGVHGNHPHRGDTGIPFRFARSVAQHGTNPDDARISSQTRCLPLLAIRLRHPTGSSNPCLVLDRSAGEWLAPASLHTDPGPAPRRMPRRRAQQEFPYRSYARRFELNCEYIGGKAAAT